MGTFNIGQSAFTAPGPEPGLYVVSTPIGNLGDITLRALEILSGVDIIACEDTRVTARLLQRYAITARRVAYNEHNADREGPTLLAAMEKGKSVALVSDAGTPLLSDPGQRLVNEAVERGLKVIPVPGASAPLAALVASGSAMNAFTFAGFLPHKQGRKRSMLGSLTNRSETLVFFEAPTRLAASLRDMAELFGPDRPACICRELTKLHEEFRRGSLAELAQHYADNPARGEIVVIVEPQSAEAISNPDDVLAELLKDMTVSRAATEAARLTGLPKRELYQRALKLSSSHDQGDGGSQ